MSYQVTNKDRIGVELDDQTTDMQNWLVIPAGFDGTNYHAFGIDDQGRQSTKQYIWDSSSLAWVAANSAGGVVGGGSSSVSYITMMDDTGTYLYVGEAVPGTSTSSANWRIRRVADTSVLYADGNSNFDNVWDNRTSLSYS